MNTQQFLDNIRATYAKGISIIEVKNKDYANSTNPFRNFESASVVGIGVERAILLRVLDKLSRCSNLIDRTAAVKDESMEDTLIDAINYLAILKAYRERNRIDTQSVAGSDATQIPGVGGQHAAELDEALHRSYKGAKQFVDRGTPGFV